MWGQWVSILPNVYHMYFSLCYCKMDEQDRMRGQSYSNETRGLCGYSGEEEWEIKRLYEMVYM